MLKLGRHTVCHRLAIVEQPKIRNIFFSAVYFPDLEIEREKREVVLLSGSTR